MHFKKLDNLSQVFDSLSQEFSKEDKAVDKNYISRAYKYR